MAQLSIDQLRELLPDISVLRPLLDRALAQAAPDPKRAWSAAGEVGTIGARVIDPTILARQLPNLLSEVRDHYTRVYQGVFTAMERAAEEDWDGTVRELLNTGQGEVESGRPHAALAFVEAALGLRERVHDRRTLLPAALTGARLNRQLGRYATAEALYQEGASLAQDAGMRGPATRAWIGLGNLAVDRGRWDEALARYQEAETLMEGSADPLPEEWHIPLNRSIVARRRGDLEAARQELERARERALRHVDEGRDAILWNAEGQLQEEMGRAVAAEESFRIGLAAAPNPGARATIALNLAQHLARQGRTMEAGELAREAEAEVLRSGVLNRLPEVYRVLGMIASASDRSEALVLFEQALGVIDAWDLPRVERARTLEAYGEWECANQAPEAGRARLEEALATFRSLGCEWDAKRLARRLAEEDDPVVGTSTSDSDEG